MRRTALALVALAALATAAPATAQPLPQPQLPESVRDCLIQYLLVAEPAPRPIQISSEGDIYIYPSEITDKVGRDVSRTTRFALCLAAG